MIDQFKNDVMILGDSELINKYYLSGSAFALDDNKHYKLRQSIADYFKVDYPQVFIVGSAKLGFSIKPKRRFKPFYDQSDIDIVVVSSCLFEKIWKEVFLFEKNGGYWSKMKDFKNYHFQGWIRLDKAGYVTIATVVLSNKGMVGFFRDAVSVSGNAGAGANDKAVRRKRSAA